MNKEEMCFIVTPGVIVLDFSKAFDVVHQHRFLHKLDHYGERPICVTGLGRSIGDVFQHLETLSPEGVLLFALARPWNGRPN